MPSTNKPVHGKSLKKINTKVFASGKTGLLFQMNLVSCGGAEMHLSDPLLSVFLSPWTVSAVMQAQEVLRQLRIPELEDVRQYVRGFPTNALMGIGAFAAITTYWFATRPKALKPPCDLGLQSVEIPVSGRFDLFADLGSGLFSALTCSRINWLEMKLYVRLEY